MFTKMSEVRRANRRAGHHWFEASTMTFFSSRVETDLFGGRFFISSEQGPSGVRAFTVREASPDGAISTPDALGGFQGHPDLKTATSALLAALMADEITL